MIFQDSCVYIFYFTCILVDSLVYQVAVALVVHAIKQCIGSHGPWSTHDH
jgi:hypothetical protein